MLVPIAIVLFAASGLAALFIASPRWSSAVGAGGAVAGAVAGLFAAFGCLLSGAAWRLDLAWSLPIGRLCLQMDALSAFFVAATLFLCGLAAVYGAGYMRSYAGRRLGPSWMFFNLLAASMTLVLTAADSVLFLMAWEIMALASFFLVVFEDEREDARRAGRIYLIATHLGVLPLLAMFLLLGGASGGTDFSGFTAGGAPGLLFLLAVLGFGAKAGFIPLHVWLPEAHPAAPSHVSAVMSGVMIKTGVYGLARALTWFGAPPPWWGWTLVAIGAVSGVWGVLFALAQHDLKRLLAYHSVENIGIIALGLGVGLLGVSYGSPTVAALGFAGGLLHVLNHALFKGLLFLGAGAALHATRTRDMDRMGGLMKRMPWTGACFFVGAAAISALPPFNGFISEFLIYVGAFRSAGLEAAQAAPAIVVILSLALIGGLALACFAKAAGMVFLGEPRAEEAARAHEAGWLMRASMLILALACALIGLASPLALELVAPAARVLAPAPGEAVAALAQASALLARVSAAAATLAVLAGGLWLWRGWLLRGRGVERTVTWDCGYARPTARMQYTASSFAHPMIRAFGALLPTRAKVTPPEGLFPKESSFHSHTPDLFLERVFGPAFAGAARFFSRLRWVQQGRVQVYVLYVALTALLLLLWKLR